MTTLQQKASLIRQKRMVELVELLRIHRELASSYYQKINLHVTRSWGLNSPTAPRLYQS